MIYIHPSSYIGTHEDLFESSISIGKYTSIGNNIKFLDSDHPSATLPVVSNFPFHEKWQDARYPKCFGKRIIEIGNDVWIGDGVILIAPLKIENGAIIGAGSVVASNVIEYSVSWGNPCKMHGIRFTTEQRHFLNQIKWWDWEESIIRERLSDMTDINSFISKYGKS